ncbi:hypothetical protein HMPREF1624_00702 [Sporothrix schenckii ATCC 58251]|uniref:Xylanolytic transcriptional activator regulatory domain-containing protein n=2 Tax=Sporothrix schenckii TaxID=29908 RepID=U7Q3G7_SPOS1|nr:hypothetical protein HMPREF1624_00702 [Sporothrix schenckii ATCC 58251]
MPPYPYAVFLARQFMIYVAHDWHWFRLRRFHERLVRVYTTPDAPDSKDRLWLCQLLVAFALGASIGGHDPTSHVRRPGSAPPETPIQVSAVSSVASHVPGAEVSGPSATPSTSANIPGVEYLEQALGLLKIPYEEASVEHIETLNMVALCSYGLNRQQTTYMYAGVSARMCNMLQLHLAASSRDCGPVERENRKRVWWTTFCIDRMASTQMGVLPALHIDQADLTYPASDGLAREDMAEFADPDYLTARIQLTVIQADAVGSGDADTDDTPALGRLTAWKAALPVHMAVPFHAGMAASEDDTAVLRSLANLHLRYNHCVILLLRPRLLRQIASIVANDAPNEDSPAREKTLRQNLNHICLDAARSSLNMLFDLRACGLLTHLGFMENMHLFSSLVVLCLAKLINTRRPHSFPADPRDDVAYDTGRDLMQDMAAAGSLAARGHLRMLADVEALARSIAAVDGDAAVDVRVEQRDADDWIALLFDENLADPF